MTYIYILLGVFVLKSITDEVNISKATKKYRDQ